MTDQTPIARVVAVTGEVYVRNENGELRLLAPDSVIYPGERIVADPGESVELAMANGQSILVDSQTPLTFSQDMLPETADNAEDAAVEGDSVDELLKALENGEEIDDLIDAPAAGAGADDGHSFVILERITESIGQQNLGGSAPGAELPDLELLESGNESVAVALASEAQEPGNAAPTLAVTLSPALDENSAAAGNTVATFTATDEEDGTPSVDFTGTSNSAGYYVISGSSVNLTAAGAAFVQGGGTLPAVNLTATDGGGLTASDSETPTVNAQNDAPITSDNIITINEDVARTLELSDFAYSDEEGASLDHVTITSLPADGVLTLGGVAVVAGATVTSAQLTSGALVFTPDLHESGNAYSSFNFTVNDGVYDSAPATTTFDITAVADAPVITLDASVVNPVTHVNEIPPPVSTGLKLSFYDELRNLDRDAALQEGVIDPATATSQTRQITGFGTNKTITNTNVVQTDGSTIEVDQGDSYSVTGLIYLEAGSTYQFSGYRDDSLRIELGGETLISTTGDSWGNFGQGTSSLNGPGNIFTAPVNGYYTLEVFTNNVSGPGQFSLNINVDGGPAQLLNATNFNIYTDVTDLIAVGGQFSNFVASTVNTDGGHFPQMINTGVVDSLIEISNIDVKLTDKDGSEVIQSVVISTIPVGATLVSGSDSFTATAGNTEVDVSSWALNDIQILPPSGFTGNIELTVIATSKETSNSSTASASETITVNVIDFNTITNGIDPDLLGTNNIVRGTAGDDNLSVFATNVIIDGGDGNDTLSGGSTDDLLIGGLGNDTLTGAGGNDVLFGSAGNDTLSGGTGSDLLAGGAGNDSLAGGAGVDTFSWELNDQGAAGSPAVDTISDFNNSVSDHDVLDLRDLLVDEQNGDLTSYLHVRESGGNTYIDVSTQGQFSSGPFDAGEEVKVDQTIELTGVDFGSIADQSALLQSLVDTGKLITD